MLLRLAINNINRKRNRNRRIRLGRWCSTSTTLAFLMATAVTISTALQPHIPPQSQSQSQSLPTPIPRHGSSSVRTIHRRLVWHRNKDLRFHDHPFYDNDDESEIATATASGDATSTSSTTTTTTTSVFVFDDAFGCGIRPSTCLPNEWKAVHLGPHGMRILLESVRDLRANSFRRIGIHNNNNSDTNNGFGDLAQELVVRRGPTVPVLLEILEELMESDMADCALCDTNSDNDNGPSVVEYRYEVCWNEEPGWHERELSEAVKIALTERFETLREKQAQRRNHPHIDLRPSLFMNTALSCTLYHPEDLPSPGEWRPPSKKEKRRRQKQLQKQSLPQKHLPKKQGNERSRAKRNRDISDNGNSDTVININNNKNSNNSNINNSFVDVSLDRWNGMPRIMGDFRKIARDTAGVRRSRGNATPMECNSKPTAPLSSIPHRAKTNMKIDPGALPSLEDLLEPLLSYLNGSDNDDDGGNQNQNGHGTPSPTQIQPILGLPPSVIKGVCDHSLRIYHENLRAIEEEENNPNSNPNDIVIRGGETAGLEHLDDFVRHHAHRAQRSLACVDHHQSSRLSHSLAFGCLSPRTVVAAAEAANEARLRAVENDGTTSRTATNPPRATANKKEAKDEHENDGTWLISHMTMRDFFLYTCLASGQRFYRREGIPVSAKVAAAIEWRSFDGHSEYNPNRNQEHNSKTNSNTNGNIHDEGIHPRETRELWTSWATGATGLPLVDAAMAELLETGYCSNRVRQNAASVLAKDLSVDWRAGAEWFQFLLVDHCVGANWGNWLYFSGVGPDPKNRHFCTVSQAAKYDPSGAYVKRWVPRTASLPSGSSNSTINDDIEEREFHLRPWDFDPSWKCPIVDPESQYTWRDLQKLRETGRLWDEDENERPIAVAKSQPR